MHAYGHSVVPSVPDSATIINTVTDKSSLESALLSEVGGRSRLSEDKPPMQEPLVVDLEYNGLTKVGREILSGT